MNDQELLRSIEELEKERLSLLEKYNSEESEVMKEKIKVDGRIVSMRLKALLIAKEKREVRQRRLI